MIISIAIWLINNLAQYRLTNSHASNWEDIVEWYGPGSKPTKEELIQAWESYEISNSTNTSEIIRLDQIKANAESEIVSIPNWASWTKEQANAWYQENIRDPFTNATNLTAMKAVIGVLITVQWNIIRMLIALRNKTYPWMESHES